MNEAAVLEVLENRMTAVTAQACGSHHLRAVADTYTAALPKSMSVSIRVESSGHRVIGLIGESLRAAVDIHWLVDSHLAAGSQSTGTRSAEVAGNAAHW